MFRSLQKALKETGKTQTELSKILAIPQPKISDILNGKIAGFSVERLAQLLIRLNYEICVDIHPAPSGCDGRIVMLQNTQSV
ncbi:MAG: XRE family transcriptional regulator [Cyanobacteria bacterium SZAS LIN-2]|nr:XRE family transcriptional regulator [Cyanobacteria bacterium SZAS LIN-2]